MTQIQHIVEIIYYIHFIDKYVGNSAQRSIGDTVNISTYALPTNFYQTNEINFTG